MAPIVTRTQAQQIAAEKQKSGLRVGYTSGVFDLLHPGHVDYLEKARAKCDFLIVGINDDSSVKENKGELRPIVSHLDRARVIAGLASVDLVFVFSEKNNAANIEAIRPSFYFKAGDYKKEQLTSAPLVESYGGKVVLVPVLAGYSSTAIIYRIAARAPKPEAVSSALAPLAAAPAVFVDRDGTINQHVEFLSTPEQFELIPQALEGLKRLKDAGFRIVVITNQPGIGLGYFSKEDFYRVNRKLLQSAQKIGLLIDKIYFCPHSEAESCSCRKPGTALIERAIRELNIIREKSYVIGDTTIDMMLAKNAGCRGLLVRTGMGGNDKRFDVAPDTTVADLREAATSIIGHP